MQPADRVASPFLACARTTYVTGGLLDVSGGSPSD